MAFKGTTKYYSNMQEREVAEEVRGRVVIASGALDDKGDVRSDNFLIECKTTEKKEYTFRAGVWLKLRSEAYKLGLTPVVNIDLKSRYGERYRLAIMREEDFFSYAQNTLFSLDERKKKNRKIISWNKSLKISDEDWSYAKLVSPYIEEECGDTLLIFPWESFLIISQVV